MEAKSDRNEESSSSGGNEVTAEWIVRAQLKITQPKKKATSFGTGDCGARRHSGSPCRIVYKWNSDGKSQDHPLRDVKNSSVSAVFRFSLTHAMKIGENIS